jgi:hypothetical protein
MSSLIKFQAFRLATKLQNSEPLRMLGRNGGTEESESGNLSKTN